MRHLSPRDLADALGVSESSLKRWVDAGKLAAFRTEGGHRRITVNEALRFIRETNAPVSRPELLGMPEVALAPAGGDERLLEYLREGDVVGTRGFLLARHLAGEPISALVDGPIREAMEAIGELWLRGDHGIFIEHRATDTCLQAVAHLRNMIDPPHNAPLAVGAVPEGDTHMLPSFLAATVLASEGLRAVNLGADTPLSALQHAVEYHHPRLVWISASMPVHPARARANQPVAVVALALGDHDRGRALRRVTRRARHHARDVDGGAVRARSRNRGLTASSCSMSPAARVGAPCPLMWSAIARAQR